MNVILGIDGKVHAGHAVRRLSGWDVETDCGTDWLRTVGEGETWWQKDETRLCTQCFEEVKPETRLLAEMLLGIDGAYDRALLGLRQAEAGETVPLDELVSEADAGYDVDELLRRRRPSEDDHA